jgi:catechol 2,3-dioxygenase-like lactoylglutathione lyase family enzyme
MGGRAERPLKAAQKHADLPKPDRAESPATPTEKPTMPAKIGLRYVTLGTADVAHSKAFYDAVLAPLGLVCVYSGEKAVGYDLAPEHGGGTAGCLWVLEPFDGAPQAPGNGTMTALGAPSPSAVDAFHRAALANGGRDEGAPGLRPQYGPDFYAAYVRDPFGNKLAAVHKGA